MDDGACESLPELPLSRQAGWGSPSLMPCLSPVPCWDPRRGSTGALKPQPPFRLTQIRFWVGWAGGGEGPGSPVLQNQSQPGYLFSVGTVPMCPPLRLLAQEAGLATQSSPLLPKPFGCCGLCSPKPTPPLVVPLLALDEGRGPLEELVSVQGPGHVFPFQHFFQYPSLWFLNRELSRQFLCPVGGRARCPAQRADTWPTVGLGGLGSAEGLQPGLPWKH